MNALNNLKKCLNVLSSVFVLFSSFLLLPPKAQAAIPSIRSGTLTTDETWTGEILVTGDVIIPNQRTLTILPGTIVRFQALYDDQVSGYYTDRSEILIDGRLVAQGTAGSPITFTSSSSNPQPNDWGGIFTGQGDGPPTNPDTIFEYSIFEYSTVSVSYWHRPPRVRNSIFRFNSVGLYHNSCTACTNGVIENNEFYQNEFGLSLCCFAHDQVIGNNFHDNIEGIHIFYYPAPIISCNLIRDNQRGVVVQGYGYITYPEIHASTILNNAFFDLANEEQTNISATGNYWGTTDPGIIAQHIIDHKDNAMFGTVDFSNFLEGPPSCAPSPNQPPTVSAGGPYNVNEGDTVILTASGLDPEGGLLTFAWDRDNNGSFETPGQSVSFAGLDGPETFTVAVQVTDNGGLTAVASTTVTVNNVPPTVGTPALSPEPSMEGSSVIASATFTDPAGSFDEPYTCTVNYGDGYSSLAGTVSGNTCSGPSHSYQNVGSYTVTISITDKDAGIGSNSITHAVIYNFTGFFQPVDNSGSGPALVFNVIKAGRGVPVKFSVSGDHGLNIFAPGYPKSQQVTCDTVASLVDIEETITVGASSLSYDPIADQYIYHWKTNTAWSNTCRQLVVRLIDGIEHIAYFKFK